MSTGATHFYWLFVDRFGLVIFFVAIALPFVLPTLAARYDRRRLSPGEAAHLTVRSCGGCLLGSVLFITLLAVTRCGNPPAGEGYTAQAWFERSAPVIAALERFQTEHHGFPLSLQELLPRYLPDTSLAAVPHDSLNSLDYLRDSTGYLLRFRYRVGNECKYSRVEKRWSCVQYNRSMW